MSRVDPRPLMAGCAALTAHYSTAKLTREQIVRAADDDGFMLRQSDQVRRGVDWLAGIARDPTEWSRLDVGDDGLVGRSDVDMYITDYLDNP